MIEGVAGGLDDHMSIDDISFTPGCVVSPDQTLPIKVTPSSKHFSLVLLLNLRQRTFKRNICYAMKQISYFCLAGNYILMSLLSKKHNILMFMLL